MLAHVSIRDSFLGRMIYSSVWIDQAFPGGSQETHVQSLNQKARLEEDRREISGVMEMFHTLIETLVTWLCIFRDIH